MPAFRVAPVSPDDAPAACRLLAANRPSPERAAAAARYRHLLDAGEFDAAGLFTAIAEGDVIGVMLAQPLAGALGLAWPPRFEPGAEQVADALTTATCGWLRERGVRVCQAFGAPDDRDDFAPLLRHGFRRVTQVADMRRELDPFTPHEPAAVELVPFDANPDAFTATLLLTYAGSLDAPELTGDRTHAEVVAGLRGNGLIGSDWWFLATRENDPVGVVMWEPSTDAGAMEVSYLGLVPAARGRGLGDELVRRSLAFAAGRGFDTLTLSVDVRNEPALRLYRRHGFRDLDRRDVYLAGWPCEGSE